MPETNTTTVKLAARFESAVSYTHGPVTMRLEPGESYAVDDATLAILESDDLVERVPETSPGTPRRRTVTEAPETANEGGNHAA